MNPTTTHIWVNTNRLTRRSVRAGVSLLEVIACTALVAIMALPISGVIRASGQAIAQSEQDVSTEARLRRGLRWLSDSIDDGDVISVGRNQIQVTLASGAKVQFAVQDGSLVMDDGRNRVIIVESVRQIRFTDLRRPTPPNDRIGIGMQLTAPDPITKTNVTIDAVSSIRNQF